MEDVKKIDPYQPPQRPEEKPAANVFELLDRILDKGLVIIGDIRISVADIELLKLQIRLLIASVDTAKKMGIDFSWAKAIEDPKSKDELRIQVKELEDKLKEQQGGFSGQGPKAKETKAVGAETTETKTTGAEVEGSKTEETKHTGAKTEGPGSTDATGEKSENLEPSESTGTSDLPK
jgi:hypothetical protein